jgi:hypothetical protein
VQDPKWTPAAEKAKSGFDAGEALSTLFGLIHWTTGEILGSFVIDPSRMFQTRWLSNTPAKVACA